MGPEEKEEDEEKKEEREQLPMDPTMSLEEKLDHAAHMDKGREVAHELKGLQDIVNKNMKMPLTNISVDMSVLLSKSKREKQLVRKIASLEHLRKYYDVAQKKLETHLERSAKLLALASDAQGQERLSKMSGSAKKQLADLKARIKHADSLLFDARRALEYSHQKRTIRKTLNVGEQQILKSVTPMLKIMEERILAHMELLRSHLKEENTAYNETQRMFASQMEPLKGPRMKEVKTVAALNGEIRRSQQIIRRYKLDRSVEIGLGNNEMLQCKANLKKIVTRAATLDDILDRLQETQLLVANKIAKLRVFWQRALYRLKKKDPSNEDIVGPTPFEDTPDKLKNGHLVMGNIAQLKRALSTMYNEVIPPQQADVVDKEAIPDDTVLQGLAKVNALVSVEVDSGFETWKAAVAARNRSLDDSILAHRNLEQAENNLATVEFEYKEEKKKWDQVNVKYTRTIKIVDLLKTKVKHLSGVVEKLDVERESYQIKYENLIADQQDRLDHNKKLAEMQVERAANLVNDQDAAIADAEEQETKSQTTLERANQQAKKLEKIKTKADERAKNAKVAKDISIVNADAAANTAEVANNNLHAMAQAISFIEVGEPTDVNTALADASGLDKQLEKINKLEEKVHPSLKYKAKKAASIPPNDEEKAFLKAGEQDNYASVVSILQNSLKGLHKLNSVTLEKVQGNIEDALKQAEDDEKNARSDLNAAKEEALNAEKRRKPLLQALAKAKALLQNVSSLKVTPNVRALRIKEQADKIQKREYEVRYQLTTSNQTLGNETVALAKLEIQWKRQKKLHEEITRKYLLAKKKVDEAIYNKKRSEMEVSIRKKDLDIVTDMFRKVCDREEQKGVKVTLEHKCCLAYVADCPGRKKAFIGYENPKPPVPVSMRDDRETLVRLKREVTRLRLMKATLDESTKEALEKAHDANLKKAEAEKEEAAENKKLQLEKQQEEVNKNEEEKEEKFNALMNPSSASGGTGGASTASGATGATGGDATGSDSTTKLLEITSSKLRGNLNRKLRKQKGTV